MDAQQRDLELYGYDGDVFVVGLVSCEMFRAKSVLYVLAESFIRKVFGMPLTDMVFF